MVKNILNQFKNILAFIKNGTALAWNNKLLLLITTLPTILFSISPLILKSCIHITNINMIHIKLLRYSSQMLVAFICMLIYVSNLFYAESIFNKGIFNNRKIKYIDAISLGWKRKTNIMFLVNTILFFFLISIYNNLIFDTGFAKVQSINHHLSLTIQTLIWFICFFLIPSATFGSNSFTLEIKKFFRLFITHLVEWIFTIVILVTGWILSLIILLPVIIIPYMINYYFQINNMFMFLIQILSIAIFTSIIIVSALFMGVIINLIYLAYLSKKIKE